MVWAGPVATSKLLGSPDSHIKGNSVLKACWADICWGEHVSADVPEMWPLHLEVEVAC